jgi:hypothetical protein
VHEKVFSTIVRSDKSVAFICVKPLYSTFAHCILSYLDKYYIARVFPPFEVRL